MGIPLWNIPSKADKFYPAAPVPTEPKDIKPTFPAPPAPPATYAAAVRAIPRSSPTATPRRPRDTPPSASSIPPMLTLDEFLRETTTSTSTSPPSTSPPPAAATSTTTSTTTPTPPRPDPGHDYIRALIYLRDPPSRDPESLRGFDTLVSQIHQIGALHDASLTGIERAAEALERSAHDRTDLEPGERERQALAAWRVRQATLRAWQTRLDLLAGEFAALRSAGRERRRAEGEGGSEASASTSSAAATAGSAVGGEGRRIVRRLLLNPGAVPPVVVGVAGGRSEGEGGGGGAERAPAPAERPAPAQERPTVNLPAAQAPSEEEPAPVLTQVQRDAALRNMAMEAQLANLPM